MVYVSNNGHVSDVVSLVHDFTDLLDGEVGHVKTFVVFLWLSEEISKTT